MGHRHLTSRLGSPATQGSGRPTWAAECGLKEYPQHQVTALASIGAVWRKFVTPDDTMSCVKCMMYGTICDAVLTHGHETIHTPMWVSGVCVTSGLLGVLL